MRLAALLLVSLISLLMIVLPVSATNENYTIAMNSSDIVRVNQSIVQDPTGGASTPFTVWIGAGITGLALVLISLLKPRTEKMDYESSIIVSVMAWPFCWVFMWGCLTSVDYIVGVVMTSTSGTSVVVTQHILYSFWWLGLAGVSGSIFAIIITILLITQFQMFQSAEPKDKILPETK